MSGTAQAGFAFPALRHTKRLVVAWLGLLKFKRRAAYHERTSLRRKLPIKYGTACVNQAYGDWTGISLRSWKDQLLKQAIQPIEQFAYTHGKNATDMAMMIDAMDLLYSNSVDCFCLVSSDSDFTRLVVLIRESGLRVWLG